MLTKPTLGSIKLFPSVLLLGISIFLAQNDFITEQEKSERTCYFIAVNSVVENQDKTYVERQITLLLDPTEFTETKLRIVADNLFKKYPEPKRMHVSLYSHIDQMRNLILGRIEQNEPNEADDKYPYAVILRDEGNELIRYALPPERGWKTVVLKGRDVALPNGPQY